MMSKAKEKDTPTLISVRDMLDREQKCVQRLADIGVSRGYIKESVAEFDRLADEKARQEHWEHHLRCDGLPRPYLPPEMRTFIAEKRFYQQFHVDQNTDWTLSVDERTVLTQDIFRTDRTRSTMKETLNDHLGNKFEVDISMYLQTIIRIDCMLDNSAEMTRVEYDRQIEIMSVRQELEQEIDAAFDRLTYSVIRMDGVYMNSEDAMVATWGHKSKIFGIDIWALRNVPIRFRALVAPIMIADMPSAGVTVQMPLSVLHDCLTLRCIHTNFDNYSQYAKSHEVILLDPNKEPSAGLLDIQDCLSNEWIMQVEIQEELLQILLEKRGAYEEIMRYIAERIEKQAKEKKANEGKAVKMAPIPKPPKEPIKVNPGWLPDAIPTFLEREQQQYLDMLDEIYNPKNLKLFPDEINLRKFIMLGGLYSIMFVRRAGNTHYQKFNIVLHEDGRVLQVRPDVVADLRKPRFGDGSLVRGSSQFAGLTKSRMRVTLEKEHKRHTVMLEDDEMPYFYITLQLPLELCLWGEPVVCQYMTTWQESVSDISLAEERKESVHTKKDKRKSKVDPVRVASEMGERQLPLTRISRNVEAINVFRPTLICLLRQSQKLSPYDVDMPLRNFGLLQQLKHLHIRQLERYCAPRILSSFKFPLEIREALEQAYENRQKKGNMLFKRRSIDVEEIVDFGEIDFTFEAQEGPERLFPVFHDVEHVKYNPDDITRDAFESKTIYGLLEKFDSIKTQYVQSYKHIMNQTDFELKVEKHKKTVVPTTDVRTTLLKNRSFSTSKVSTRGSGLSTSNSQTSAHRTSSNVHVGGSPPHVEVQDGNEFHGSAIIGGSVATDHSTDENEEKTKNKVLHWTTQNIISSEFDRKARTMTIKTDRLGIFGLAFHRYEHFPFRDWSMYPNEENPEEIILTVDTFHARVILYITNKGVRGYVTELSKGYVAKPIKYLDIQEPISDFRVLRRRFLEKNVNIFAEHDASYYIENGYFSVKHVATEDHIYDVMALHCKLMKFYRSSWNRLATRRNVLMCMKSAKDQSDYTEVTVRIEPDHVTFVEVSELCSDDLDIIKLDFKTTWRTMSYYTDLHQAIASMYPHATDVRNKDPMLLYQLKRMLSEIHILNFS